jgi:hypothetical protein
VDEVSPSPTADFTVSATVMVAVFAISRWRSTLRLMELEVRLEVGESETSESAY